MYVYMYSWFHAYMYMYMYMHADNIVLFSVSIIIIIGERKKHNACKTIDNATPDTYTCTGRMRGTSWLLLRLEIICGMYIHRINVRISKHLIFD